MSIFNFAGGCSLVGYRRAKVFVCTREKVDFARRPGTGERKWLSVPVKCSFLHVGRVQEKKKCDLYPICAGKWTKTGYRKAKEVVCTREKADFARRSGTGAQKVLPVPVAFFKHFMSFRSAGFWGVSCILLCLINTLHNALYYYFIIKTNPCKKSLLMLL